MAVPVEARILRLIAGVLDVEEGSGLHADTETVNAFTARMRRDQVQEMLGEQHAYTDGLTRVTPFWCPSSALEEPIAVVRDLLGKPAIPRLPMSAGGSASWDGDRAMSLYACGRLTW